MILNYKTQYSKIRLMLFFILVACLNACGDDIYVLNSAYWEKTSVVGSTGGSAAITISGKQGSGWTAKIEEGASWCSFSKSNQNLSQVSGFITDGDNLLTVYCRYYAGSVDRQATITLTFDGKDSRVLTLTQTPSFSGFTETPSYKEHDDYQYVTHFASLNNRAVRNYSLCFDRSKKAALWVAYPIHGSYLGSTNRTNEWGFDPNIDSYFQADCISRSYGGRYDRGHQLPSADRLANREMNVQTFYMSNMTPQLDRLNQDMWANLEIKVRENNCNDTLFVVTGAYFDENSTASTYDGAGNSVPLPTHYFKVLLRTKTGSTGKAVVNCSDDELKSIGFWVEHRSYGNVEPPRSICKTVAEIEALTGFEFFPKVSDQVKQQNNPGQWGL
jgi:endonuclease G